MEPDPQNSAPRRVEAYLDQVLAPLTRRLSTFHQQELRRELRTHLWERVSAYDELGMTEDQAITEALRQFGGAEDFLRQWQREWRKTPPQAVLREIATATRCALLLSLPALLITCLGSPPFGAMQGGSWIPIPDWMYNFPLAYVTSGWVSFGLNLVFLPLTVGAAVGRLAPQRAALGMFAALTVEIVLTGCSLLPTVLNSGWFTEHLSVHLSEQIFLCSIFWLPLACTSAALTGWWPQKRTKRPLWLPTIREVWKAGEKAYKLSAAGVVSALLPFVVINACYQGMQHSAVGKFLEHYAGPIYLSWIGFAFLALPVFVGMRQGWRQPKHAGVGMAAALVSGIAAISLLYETVDGHLPNSLFTEGLYAEELCSVLLTLLVIWLPVASGSAALSGWWARKNEKRKVIA
jgi:hypothetical protein